MKTKWENWEAALGEVTAEYEAKRDWANDYEMRLMFYLDIRFEWKTRFRAMVTDLEGFYVKEPRVFESLNEALVYLSDADCEKYVDERREEF